MKLSRPTSHSLEFRDRTVDVPPLIPDHTLLRPIGRGAYGEVWLARNVMGAFRAVKVIWRSQFESERPFEREFAGIQRFEPVSRSSNGLVHVLHVGRNQEQDYFYYVMELADAVAPARREGSSSSSRDPQPKSEPIEIQTYKPHTLRADLNRHGRLPTGDCIGLALDVVEGLSQLHRHGLVHRDVKPGNIIYVNGRAKLADLGLVSAGGEGRTFVGTEGYIPPEGPGNAAADLYALGVVLYEASTGYSPEKFPDLPNEWLTNEGGNGALEFHEIILRACEGQRERRYNTAEAMQADLALLQSGQSLRRVRALEQRYARMRLSGIIGAVLLLCAVVAVFFANYRARVAAESRAKEARLRDQAQNSLARAEEAERDARQQLFTALWGEARATVRSGVLGQRIRALEALRSAASISNRVELRREVFAALAQPDLRFEQEVAIGPNVTSVVCDPSFQRMALARGVNPIEIRSLPDGALLGTLTPSTNLPCHRIQWSKDGRWLVVKRDRPSGSDWEVWDVSSMRRQMLLQDMVGDNVCFHPQQNHLISVRRGVLQRWDLTNGQELAHFPLSIEPWVMEMAPDGKQFATVHSASNHYVVSVWEDLGGQVKASWPYTDWVALRWHPFGKWLAVADYGGKVQLLDPKTGEMRLLGRHKVEATTLAFTPQGDFLVSGGWEREMMCWDLRNLAPAFAIVIDSYHLQFSADGRRCATLTRGVSPDKFFYEFKLHTFERTDGFREFQEELGSRLDQAAFSSDGRWLAASGRKHVGVWDLSTPRPAPLTDVKATARLYFTPDASQLFGSSREGQWMHWQLGTSAPPDDQSPALEIQPVSLSNPRGFNSVCVASNVIVWTCSKGSQVTTCDGRPQESLWRPTQAGLTGVSPDGRWLAIYQSFGTRLSIYRLPSLEPVATLTNRASIYSFRFSPDGNEVAVASGRIIQFWSTSDWKPTRIASDFMDILYGNDSQTLWLTKDYSSAGLYDARTLQLLLPLPIGMLPLALSPDGRQLAVSVELRRLQIWDLVEVRRQLARLKLDWQD